MAAGALSRAIHRSHVYARIHRVLVVLLSAALAALAMAALPAAPASATTVPSFQCASDTVYSIDGDSGVISKITPSSGAFTSNGTISVDGTLNALAMPNGGGRYIYAYNRSKNQVVRYDATTNSVKSYSLSANSDASSVIAGAINPANGIFYYAVGGSTWKLYAFNTGTNAEIGQVGRISGLGGNGDMAFDALGNLYVVSNDGANAAGTLARVNAPLPTTAGNTSLSSTTLASLPGSSGQYAAMAFDGSGYLIIGTSTGKLMKVNPTSGAQVLTKTLSLKLHDMASCSSPSTAAARVDLPQGRHDNADQFTVKITGNGVTSGNTGTTTGTDSGLQTDPAEVAGPVVVLPSTTYTITQTAAGGTDFNDYTTTWKCVDQNTSAQVAQGSGNSGTFTMPGTSGSSVVCTFTNLPLLPAIDLVKTAGAINDLDGNGPDAGDTISYTFKVTNTGNTALSNVTLTDAKLGGAITCNATSLAIGASTTCGPKSYTLTQADVNAGKVDNTAKVTGKAPNNVVVDDTDSATVTVPANPALVLKKTAGAITDVDGNGPDAGDTITYTFKVTNTGNVPLNPVTVSDPKVGPVTCPTGALAPGDFVTCTPKSYTLTQADVDAGKVENTATATGTPPSGPPVTSTDKTTTVVPATPAISLDKTASALVDNDGNGADVGDTITYGFKVTNTGNVTLTTVGVTDPMFSGITCSPTTLAPGASVICSSKTYALTQPDVNAGQVQNTATAKGTAPNGTKVTDDDSTTTPFQGTAAIELDKVAGPLTNGKITYTFKVTNIGTVTLNSITLKDPLFGSAAINCATSTLAPGNSTTCDSKTYTLTQADLDAGKVTNKAEVTGTPTNGNPPVMDDDTTTTPVPQHPAIELDKVAGPLTSGTITYTFKVTNTGDVTLDPVTVSDPKVGPVTCPSGPLTPGASVTCTDKTYTLTQTDVNAGKVDNTATATGTSPSGTKVTDDDSTSTPVPAAPSIELVKTASAIHDNDGNGDDAGDTITYSFKVTNTGNVTLDPVVVNDPLLGSVTCPSGPLAPGASVTCTDKTYTLTQADVNAGKVDNTATAKGTPPTGSPVTDDDSTHTPVTQSPSIELVKSASGWNDINGNGLDIGDTVTYGFKVTNTGNVTLTNITVSDPKVGPVTCPSAPLLPGQSVNCDPRTYPLTQADIDHGSVVNHATATGNPPTGEPVSDDDTRTVELPATGAIQLVKTAGALVDVDGNGPDAGDTVTYSFRVTNVGNQTLDPVTVNDPMLGGAITCPSGPLQPGDSFDCDDVTYAITAADVSAGKVDNTATATGTPPDGPDVTDTDSTHTPVQPINTNVKVKKTVDDAAPHVGDTITYTLTVTNTGAADAKDVVVTDALPTGVTYVSSSAACDRTGSVVRCDAGTVPAGETRTFTVRVKVDPLPNSGNNHQHLLDVQKTEVQVDMWGHDSASGTATCMDGYVASDGSGRVDHVDQGVGTLADVHMTANHAVGTSGWKATFVNDTDGHATGKVFVVCIKKDTEVVNSHSHSIVVSDLVTQTVPLTDGINDTTLSCAPGQTPIQPGYQLDAVAPVVTSYPDDSFGWHFRVINPTGGGATEATYTLRCLDNTLSTTNGHTHSIGFDEVRKSVTVPAGQTVEYQLTCADGSKGIVAGYDIDPGLVMLGNDPRPITRAFQLYNPTSGPLGARLYLLCMGLRTEKADQSGKIVNTAKVTTTTPETNTGDNSSSVTIQVTPAATPSATVALKATYAAAPVTCGSGAGVCKGQAVLTAASTQRIRGHQVKKGAVLAKATYKIKAGHKATLKLKRTKLGKNVLGAKPLKKAKLRIDGKTRSVRLRF